jgi:hypothetical protein
MRGRLGEFGRFGTAQDISATDPGTLTTRETGNRSDPPGSSTTGQCLVLAACKDGKAVDHRGIHVIETWIANRVMDD